MRCVMATKKFDILPEDWRRMHSKDLRNLGYFKRVGQIIKLFLTK